MYPPRFSSRPGSRPSASRPRSQGGRDRVSLSEPTRGPRGRSSRGRLSGHFSPRGRSRVRLYRGYAGDRWRTRWNRGFDGFFYVSASHNPIGHNGLKDGRRRRRGDRGRGRVCAHRPLPRSDHRRSDRDAHRGPHAQPHESGRTRLPRLGAEHKARRARGYATSADRVIAGSGPPLRRLRRLSSRRRRSAPGGPRRSQRKRASGFDRPRLPRSDRLLVHLINDEPGPIAHQIVPGRRRPRSVPRGARAPRLGGRPWVLGYVPDNDGDRGNLVFYDASRQVEARQLEAQEVFALSCVAELSLARLHRRARVRRLGHDRRAEWRSSSTVPRRCASTASPSVSAPSSTAPRWERRTSSPRAGSSATKGFSFACSARARTAARSPTLRRCATRCTRSTPCSSSSTPAPRPESPSPRAIWAARCKANGGGPRGLGPAGAHRDAAALHDDERVRGARDHAHPKRFARGAQARDRSLLPEDAAGDHRLAPAELEVLLPDRQLRAHDRAPGSGEPDRRRAGRTQGRARRRLGTRARLPLDARQRHGAGLSVMADVEGSAPKKPRPRCSTGCAVSSRAPTSAATGAYRSAAPSFDDDQTVALEAFERRLEPLVGGADRRLELLDRQIRRAAERAHDPSAHLAYRSRERALLRVVTRCAGLRSGAASRASHRSP